MGVEACIVARLDLLRLEEEDGAVAEVEVDEVLCLCKCRYVSTLSPSEMKFTDTAKQASKTGKGKKGSYKPWVTKLPKFRPTIQCHVGPLRSSNVFLMCCAMSFSVLNLSIASCAVVVVSWGGVLGSEAGTIMA